MNEFVRTPSGIKISIRHLRAEKKKAIVVAPGFFQSKSTPTFQKIADDLKNDFDVISMDFRGHGQSGGAYTFSALEKEDLKAVIDYARKSYPKIGVLGFSYGGAIAILEQAEFKNIDSLICVSSPMAPEEIEFRWWTPRAIRLGAKGLEPAAGFRPGNPFLPKIRPLDVISSLPPAPIYFMHGSEDPTVDMRHSRLLYEKANDPKKIKIIERGSHAEELYRQYPALFIVEVKGWFSETLEGKIA